MLAAGRGTRLAPLTDALPKALCPVANVALIDRALARVGPVARRVAVNVHHHPGAMIGHLAGRALYISDESEQLLGSAGAVGRIAEWLDGRALLIHNADAHLDPDPVARLVDGWDGERPRLLVVDAGGPADFGSWRYAGLSLLPARQAAACQAEPSGLYEQVWGPAWEEGRLELVEHDGFFVDCGTPAGYLAANLHESGGETVVGLGASVEGEAVRCVIWPGGRVESDERLVECIRAPGPVTVDARSGG